MPNATYSFLDVHATLSGPGGTVSLGAGAGNAEEGISMEFTEDKDRLVFGADGSPMHSLIASQGGKALVRVLKTSPINSVLAALYNFQKSSSALWGQNVFTLVDPVSGDDYTGTQVAFTKFPRNDFAKEAGMLEWDLNIGVLEVVLGNGILAL
jgi:hypothetical protein